MKKIVVLIAILTIILSTLLCSAAVFAVAPPPSTNILGDGWDHNGTFEVAVGTAHGDYNLAKDGSLPAIDLQGTSWGLNITQLEVIIPAGTTVSMNVGMTLNTIGVRMGLNGPLFITYYTTTVYTQTYTNSANPNKIKFSNNVTVKKLDSTGSWVKISEFNTLVNNIPQP